MTYEVQHKTLMGDWDNNWLYVAPDGRVCHETFDTRKEAEDALDEHLEDLEEEFHAGNTLRRYGQDEFRVALVTHVRPARRLQGVAI